MTVEIELKDKKDQNKTAQFKSMTCNVVIEFLDLHKENLFVVVVLNVNPLLKKLGEAQTLPGVILELFVHVSVWSLC